MRRLSLLGSLLTALSTHIDAQTTSVEVLYKSRFGDTTFSASDTVIVAPRALTMRGRFDLPGSSHALAGTVQQFGDSIMLDLTAYPPSDGFVQMVDPVEFEAKVTGLPPGRYVLCVRYNTVRLGLSSRVVKYFPVTVPP